MKWSELKKKIDDYIKENGKNDMKVSRLVLDYETEQFNFPKREGRPNNKIEHLLFDEVYEKINE